MVTPTAHEMGDNVDAEDQSVGGDDVADYCETLDPNTSNTENVGGDIYHYINASCTSDLECLRPNGDPSAAPASANPNIDIIEYYATMDWTPNCKTSEKEVVFHREPNDPPCTSNADCQVHGDYYCKVDDDDPQPGTFPNDSNWEWDDIDEGRCYKVLDYPEFLPEKHRNKWGDVGIGDCWGVEDDPCFSDNDCASPTAYCKINNTNAAPASFYPETPGSPLDDPWDDIRPGSCYDTGKGGTPWNAGNNSTGGHTNYPEDGAFGANCDPTDLSCGCDIQYQGAASYASCARIGDKTYGSAHGRRHFDLVDPGQIKHQQYLFPWWHQR